VVNSRYAKAQAASGVALDQSREGQRKKIPAIIVSVDVGLSVDQSQAQGSGLQAHRKVQRCEATQPEQQKQHSRDKSSLHGL